MTRYLLGIDIGTTSTKAVLVNDAGQILADSSLPSELFSKHTGWAEEDPNQWWNNVCALIPRVLQQAAVQPEQVLAVGISGMVPTLILLDENGIVLRPSIQQNDARAVTEIDYQRNLTDESDILYRTGSAITQQSIGPKLLWLCQHEPEIMQNARHVLGSYDYFVFRLTGQFSAERNWSLESGLFDMRREDWDDSLLELATINRNWVGTVHWPADVVGYVTVEASGACGLMKGTPVVAGSADHIASAFSAGVKNEGDLLIKLGGAGDILYCVDHAETDQRLFLDYHLIPGKFLVNGCMASSGSLIRWFRDQFAPDLDYPELDKQAADIPAGAQGLVLLPYFIGEKTPINDPLARGTLVGLSLFHTNVHVYRAVLEGIAYGFKHHLRVLAEHKHQVTHTRLTNGGAHSLLWRQITADVLGLPLEQVAHHPGSSLGAAFVAGKGVGVFNSWDEIEMFIQIASITQPNPQNYALYQKLFEVYLSTYLALKPIYPKLSEACL
jgi:xylulokinase